MHRERLASSPPTVRSKQLVPQRFALVAQLGQLGLGQLAHLGVVAVDHLLGFGDLAVELLEPAILLGQLAERAVLAGDGRDARRIRQHLGIDEVCFRAPRTGPVFVRGDRAWK